MASNQDGPRAPDDPPASEAAPESVAEAAGDAGAEAERLAAEAARTAAEAARNAAIAAAGAVAERARAGLLLWGGVTIGGVLLGAIMKRGDVAPFLAIAALFALAQSWDARDRARTGDPAADVLIDADETGRLFRALVGAIPGLVTAACYAGFAAYAASLPASPAHLAAAFWCAGAGFLGLALTLRPVAGAAARWIVPFAADSHVARLTAVLAAGVLLLPLPVRLLFDEMGGWLGESGQPLIEVNGLVAQLAGEIAIALAAVGLWVSRGARATRERLGLGGMGPREWAIAAVGLGIVTGLNGGLEWLERSWLPELWRADQAMSDRLVGNISLGTSLVLGLSAGVGEEVLVRGALQPRTGLLWASVLFGAAHVQYTWFGMLVIVLLGVTLGLVRRHANTTTAIVVHAVYDVLAALGSRS